MAFTRAQRRVYRASEAGQAAERRYRQSERGRALQKLRDRKYKQSAKGRHARSRAKAWNRLRKKYGLTRAAWDAMLIAQAGRCAICGDPMPTPLVDHDHATGRVRDLLCSGCNSAIAPFERPGFPSAASAYLERHKSRLA